MSRWLNIILFVTLLSLFLVVITISYLEVRSKQQLKLMFDDYIEKFNKTYKNRPGEYITRLKRFTASLEEIDRLNGLSRGSDAQKAKYGLTKLSDMSQYEYRNVYLTVEHYFNWTLGNYRTWSEYKEQRRHEHLKQISPAYSIRKKRSTANVPLTIDWRTKGVIGPVRSQGLCRACWTSCTIGTVETMAAIKTGKFVSLGVPEALDCALHDYSGCASYEVCMLLNQLVITEQPVQASMKNATGVRVKTFTCDNFVGAEDNILEALATHGPVAVVVNALSWQNYLGGVIQDHCSGATTDLNHAVEIVGYDLTAEVPYYLVKNSWGSDYGNGGYLQLAIGSNMCGLANEVASVDVI